MFSTKCLLKTLKNINEAYCFGISFHIVLYQKYTPSLVFMHFLKGVRRNVGETKRFLENSTHLQKYLRKANFPNNTTL